MEKDLVKQQASNRKLENEIKKFKNKNQIFGFQNNNTSSNFMLPSEFKTNWEHLVQSLILDIFGDLIDEPIKIMLAVQIILFSIYNYAMMEYNKKVNKILLSIGIENSDEIDL